MTDQKLKLLTAIKLHQNDNMLPVEGRSMQPLIYEKDLIKLQRQDSYRIGDVVGIIDSGQRLLVHRIVKKEQNTLYVMGDYAVAIETVEHCFGKVTEIHKPDGTMLRVTDRYKRIIVYFSLLMNKRMQKTMDYHKTMNGWQYKALSYFSARTLKKGIG